ncbi:von Willebrand factor type A domain-containing protein [Fusarium avenaceum]|nr:von Willebrand factor type A domain-containing protein [Fusarium avenaceum]
MISRHVKTKRINSGVIFSAPGNLLAMPEGGWGEDTPINRSKRPNKNHSKRGTESFSVLALSTAMPIYEPYNDHTSIAQDKGYKEYKTASQPPPALPQKPQDQRMAGATLCLPVLNVSLTATVDGTIAHVELIQRFDNPSDTIIHTAKHIFPLYDRAVITSFECTIGDERRVIGVVKPKAQARQEFEEAVRDQVKAPAILEEHTPEIFETSLGNIPAETTVEIKITYVQDLRVVMMETEAAEGIALTIPLSIAPRYSKSPVPWDTASKLRDEKLDIWVKLVDNGRVNHEGCKAESGHRVEFEGTKTVIHSHGSAMGAAEASGTYSVWHHQSLSPVLKEDFVFIIQMQEGHHIKSRAVACPADSNGLGAMVLSIRPNDLFRNAIIPKSFTGEILFLLDRSGSMALGCGDKVPKIIVMREAMLLALAGIPTTCIFNVVSWGSATVGLWDNSKPASEDNIREAKDYVSHIKADMGGTDLLRALEAVVRRRDQQRGSTQIIVLTDGELEPEESIQFVWKKRQLLGDGIRFFALGIGEEVSHRLVESIAECGGGHSDVVHTTKTPRWHDRLNRLVKSALQPNSWSYSISLGSEFERQSLVVDELVDESSLASGKIPYFQAPFPTLPLHPFSFNSISFLVILRHGGTLPKTATITITSPEAKKKSYELPIEVATGGDVGIRCLVAKSVLLDLESKLKRGSSVTHVAKANAEKIGMMNSITSKWTSFVAVSENEPTQAEEEQKMNHYKALFDEMDIDQLLHYAVTDHSPSPPSVGTPSLSGGLPYQGTAAWCQSRVHTSHPSEFPDSDEDTIKHNAIGNNYVTADKAQDYNTAETKETFNRVGCPNAGNLLRFQHSRAPYEISSKTDLYGNDDTEALASSTQYGRLSGFGSPPDPFVMDDLLFWQFVLECQDGSGLFDFSEGVREMIHLHFCPGVETELISKISGLLKRCITPNSDEDKLRSRMLDTLMIIEFYMTHVAQEEDISDFFINKAQDAVLETLELSEDDQELHELQDILRSSIMHAHYMAATGIKESENDKEGGDLACCPVCDIAWLTARQFICPFDHESETDVDEFRSWENFWGHQI